MKNAKQVKIIPLLADDVNLSLDTKGGSVDVCKALAATRKESGNCDLRSGTTNGGR